MPKGTKSYLVLFCTLVLVSIMLNGWPAGIYPDGSIGIVQILTSIGWFAFLMGSILILKNTSLIRFLFNYLRFGFIGGMVVYLITLFENHLWDQTWFDMMSGIQYPLYVLFVVPMFGWNAFTEIPYGDFSFLIGFLYILIAFGLSLRYKKIKIERLRY